MKTVAEKPHPPDFVAMREQLAKLNGQDYWRSLDELADSDEFKKNLADEFPVGASEWPDGLSRRNFLKLAAASLALAGLSGCTKQPAQEILPFVRQPENFVPGQPLYYATAMTLGGFATGVIATNREGHPIKVDGNPEHPAALGASSVWMQASILDLYDPDRSQAVTHHGEINTWAEFLLDLRQWIGEHEANQGAGLRFLTETFTSPTLSAQLRGLLQKFPNAKLHQYDPISRDNVREGARLAFGEIVETHHRFDQAAVILSLDSDFLNVHPQRLRYAREFTDGRRVSSGGSRMNRLYVVESTPTVTGTMADHRLPLISGDVEKFAWELLDILRGNSPASKKSSAFLTALAADLEQHRGNSIVIAGEWQSARVHAIAHAINEMLGNVGRTIFYSAPAESFATNQLASFRELAEDMKFGAVQTLFILGGNPVYSAPANFSFGDLLKKIRRSVHLGMELDETAGSATWHIPQAHYLEAWGDARSFDGTVTVQQPLIAPLYGGKSVYELLGALEQTHPARNDYEIIRAHWQSQNLWPDFEKNWRRALHDGFIANSAMPARQVRLKMTREELDEGRVRHSVRADADSTKNGAQRTDAPYQAEIEITFRPDPNLWDGRFANNGWLQECAKPVSKITWDNAVLISPALAQRLSLASNDVVEVSFHGRTIRGPVFIQAGQAANSITLHLGYGRERVGRVGRGVGFNASALRTSEFFWQGNGAKLTKLNQRHQLVTTQGHHHLHSEERQIYREGTREEFERNPQFVHESVKSPDFETTLYDSNEFKKDGYQWGMSIDLNTCIGCNACLLACNVENNIPVVGKEQVSLNREMYWIRIDTYHKGSPDNPRFLHMPIPCMHCEHAPCELVCPVQAAVHDREGLNLQVYNRCIGTRFCSNNCPYKVRRFNFLRYTDYHTPQFRPMHNPEVTVRWRGVMEKCTYCVQRIAAARITAEKENRSIRDGEVRPACEQACPTQAIIFGDLNTDSRVARLKRHPLDYSMLGQLNTRPRTTYLARLHNPGALGPPEETGV